MSLADDFNRIVAERLDEMEKAGIVWSPERQAAYNAACVRFSHATEAKDQAEMDAALKIVRQMEAEGGLL